MANDSFVQRQVFLDALRRGPVSSIAARETLGILHPAARVLELRQQGLPIGMNWQTNVDAQGRRHRVGVYLLGAAA